MLRLWSLIFAIVMTTPAWAGFRAFNGTTDLKIFDSIKCDTGVTCTRVGASLDIVSSPTISTGTLTITGASSGNASLLLNADAAATNADKWEILSEASGNGLDFLNKTSGSYVSKLLLSTAGALTASGTITATGGIIQSTTAPRTRWMAWNPGVATNATSATPSATVVYMAQVYIPANTTLTGIGVLNAATVGTNKWVLALFDDTGAPLANTALAGVLTSGASVFQQIAFTGTYAAKGPRTYWIGAYMNGTTDRYYAIPTIGQMVGLSGSVSAQTFGTVASVTLPTTFTADVGPVAYVY